MEVRKYHTAPILLVGTQADLRDDAATGEKLAKASSVKSKFSAGGHGGNFRE